VQSVSTGLFSANKSLQIEGSKQMEPQKVTEDEPDSLKKRELFAISLRKQKKSTII